MADVDWAVEAYSRAFVVGLPAPPGIGDLLARTIIAPLELPVGIITASGIISASTIRGGTSSVYAEAVKVRGAMKLLAVTVLLLAVLNVLVWFVTPAWEVRVVFVMVSLLAGPVLHTLLFRRR